ncbi:hypothetical protein [Bradyrhizobium sp. F1.13.3]|uniref:hypothetical protein n=1 Tax=Bradyrhizobium sp. F1.13.3 TaxID=3156351 RepID=UPI00339836B2
MRYLPLWLFVVGICAANPLIAEAQPSCTSLPLSHPPTSITPLLRDNRDAGYFNEIVPTGQAAELHLIGSYSGSGRIVIGPTDEPVVLALSSFKPSLWRIELQSGARLQKIILFGRDEQRVSGAPADVDIVNRSSCPVSAYKWEGAGENVRYMDGHYRDFLAAAQQESGLAETSFQGSYDAGTYFSIPPSRIHYMRDPAPILHPAEVRVLLSATPAEAIARYEAAMDRAPAEFRPTMKILIDLMKDHKLPTLFPNGGRGPDPRAPIGPRYLFNPEAAVGTVDSGSDCKGFYFAGHADGGNLKCAFGNQFFVLGKANNVLDDSWGDDIVNPGSGDHVLHLGWGNDIVVLQEGWGDDIITKTCTQSVLPTNDRNRLNWASQFSNFIVFGPGIRPSDVHWEMKSTLVHEPSKSRLTIDDQCFNFVFAEAGELRPYQQPRKPAAMSNERRSPTSDAPSGGAR